MKRLTMWFYLTAIIGMAGVVIAQDPVQTDPSEGTGGAAVEATGETGQIGETDPVGETSEPALPNQQEVMDYLDNLYRAESSHARLTMNITTENWQRTLELEAWSQGEDLSVAIIRSPAREAGTATLRTDEGLWNYAPRADRLMRIPSGLLSESWMGSHFTNDDLMRESGYDDDFDTVLSWHMDGDRRLLKATMVPHPDAPIVYSQVVFYMDGERWTPVRSEFYDDEDVVRTFTYSDIREVSGRPIPMRMDVIPHDKPDESTQVIYDELELNPGVDQSLFTQRGLRRAAQRR